MKLLFLFYTIAVAASTQLETLFTEWLQVHNKQYDTALEYRYRFAVFSENWGNKDYLDSPIENRKYNML